MLLVVGLEAHLLPLGFLAELEKVLLYRWEIHEADGQQAPVGLVVVSNSVYLHNVSVLVCCVVC